MVLRVVNLDIAALFVEYVTPGIRKAICYHCSNDRNSGLPLITEQWAKYFGETKPVEPLWQCTDCKQLIPDEGFNVPLPFERKYA